MNYKGVGYVLGWIMKVEGIFLLLPVVTALIYKEDNWSVYFGCAVFSFFVGAFLARKENIVDGQFFSREGYASVALGWIVMSVIGALPFWLSREIPSYTDALFEIVSGFTTTGASILINVEELTYSALMWRSFSHWIGGMGVLVFVLQIIPATGGQNMHLMRAESPGPSVSKLVPRVRQTAFVLYGIYIAMTILEFILLIVGRMPIFDALCTTFGTAGTGGFGIKADSIAGYSPYIQIVVTVFMVLFGVNFSFFYLILIGRLKDAFSMEEVRAYFGIYAAATLLITWNICEQIGNVADSLRHAAFQVATVMTTTGFATMDFDQWPEFSKILLVLLMFVGACAGSTGGAIKVSRILIYLKTIRKELSILVHPRSVKIVLMDGKKLEHPIVRAANIFIISYLFIMAASILLISLDNNDFTTNVTAVIATLNNIGPGLSKVGPAGNFEFFSDFSKYVLMFDMLAGRLEIFPMLLLFAPGTWKK